MAMNGHIFGTQCEVESIKDHCRWAERVSRRLFCINGLNAHIVIELTLYYLIMRLDRAMGGPSIWEGKKDFGKVYGFWGLEHSS